MVKSYRIKSESALRWITRYFNGTIKIVVS